jgi:hypothetical protein
MDSSEIYVGFYRNYLLCGNLKPMWQSASEKQFWLCCWSACDAFSSTEPPTKCQGGMVVMVSHTETTVKLSLKLWAEIFIKLVHFKGSDLFCYLTLPYLFIKNWQRLYFAAFCMNTHWRQTIPFSQSLHFVNNWFCLQNFHRWRDWGNSSSEAVWHDCK